MGDILFGLKFDSSRINDVLVRIEAYRLSIDGLMFPKEWQETLRHLNIIRAIHGTTAIEGNQKTQEEVAQALSVDKTVSLSKYAPDDAQITNADNACHWIEDNFKTPRPLTEEMILHLHFLLTTKSDESDNAPYRGVTPSITVGSNSFGGVHRPPEGGENIHRLMKEFIGFMNCREVTSQPPVIQALVGHFFLVTLHPFGNGNGRTARCLESLIMYQHGVNTYGFYSLSNYFYRNRDRYFTLLQKTRTENNWDITEFLEFGLKGFVDELSRIEKYIKEKIKRVMYRNLIYSANKQKISARRRLLSDRETSMLLYILEQEPAIDPFVDIASPELWFSEFVENALIKKLYADKSNKTLLRELIALQTKGFIDYQKDNTKNDYKISINFGAISRY
ncbi:MAG: Fic family protein [bacterium]